MDDRLHQFAICQIPDAFDGADMHGGVDLCTRGARLQDEQSPEPGAVRMEDRNRRSGDGVLRLR